MEKLKSMMVWWIVHDHTKLDEYIKICNILNILRFLENSEEYDWTMF